MRKSFEPSFTNGLARKNPSPTTVIKRSTFTDELISRKLMTGEGTLRVALVTIFG